MVILTTNVNVEQETNKPLSPPSSTDAGAMNASVGEPKKTIASEPADNGVVSGWQDSAKEYAESNFHDVVLPVGFLQPLQPKCWPLVPCPAPVAQPIVAADAPPLRPSRQFWKAGDYEGVVAHQPSSPSSHAGLNHLRVHPRFLHSNATSHKWALGAFAELLDNSLDEVRNGATYVNVDVMDSKKDKSKMVVIEDDGGGMDPNKMRQCMSLGFSAKSKLTDTIGQYGNGFKTSTMRLGADVIVFTRSPQKNGTRATQSIGLLSYTFLSSTGKEDIAVPIVDYEKEGNTLKKLVQSSMDDWNNNMETILQWSPFANEDDFLHEFNSINDHGTKVIIFNLWEGDQGGSELDFDADPNDIRIRDVNPEKTQLAHQFPNSRHFFTYQHSLRSYASILYLKLPRDFKMFLRGKEILHHNLVDNMMLAEEVTYRPQTGDGVGNDQNMHALVTIGFVKDAKHHIDIQGFNVYHKNRLIKPFWRVWNAAGSNGRGIIGVLEADFVEPAHDKQGFERTTILQRLENRLVEYQKKYWSKHCHKIGYAARNGLKRPSDSVIIGKQASTYTTARQIANARKSFPSRNEYESTTKLVSSPEVEVEEIHPRKKQDKSSSPKFSRESPRTPLQDVHTPFKNYPEVDAATGNGNGTSQSNGGGEKSLDQLIKENEELKDRLMKINHTTLFDMQILRDKNRLLEDRVLELEEQLQEANKEQETLIDIFSDERIRRDKEERSLKERLQEAFDKLKTYHSK